jgi:hypothetical protein
MNRTLVLFRLSEDESEVVGERKNGVTKAIKSTVNSILKGEHCGN